MHKCMCVFADACASMFVRCTVHRSIVAVLCNVCEQASIDFIYIGLYLHLYPINAFKVRNILSW